MLSKIGWLGFQVRAFWQYKYDSGPFHLVLKGSLKIRFLVHLISQLPLFFDWMKYFWTSQIYFFKYHQKNG